MRKQVPIPALVILLALAAALYWPGLNGPFVLDDFSNILKNEDLRIESLAADEVWNTLVSRGGSKDPLHQRPLSMLSFALNYYFTGGFSPYPVKLTNLFIHLLTTVFVFLLSRGLLRRLAADGLCPAEAATAIALVATALWALHPLHVSTVLYAVQRMAALAAMFMAAGCLAFVTGREHVLAGRRQRGVFWFAVALLGLGPLAILSKETGLLLPVLLLVIEAAFYRFRTGAQSPAWLRPALKAVLWGPLFILLAALLAVWLGPWGEKPVRDFTATERLLTQSRVLWTYVAQLLLPDIGRMSLFHTEFPISRGLTEPFSTLLSVVAWVLVAAGAAYAVRARRAVVPAFGVLWFLAAHALESTVYPLELVFEHRNYLAAYGLALPVAWGLSLLVRQVRAHPWVRYGLVAVVVVAVASQLQLRVGYWSSINNFLVHELVFHPESPRAWAALGYSMARRSKYREAVRFYEMAASADPTEPGHVLGIVSIKINSLNERPTPSRLQDLAVMLSEGRLSAFARSQLEHMARNVLTAEPPAERFAAQAAERLLEAALENPAWSSERQRANTYFLVAQLRLRIGDQAGAVEAVKAGLAEDPKADFARVRLAQLLAARGDAEAAARQLRALRRPEELSGKKRELYERSRQAVGSTLHRPAGR